MRGAIGNEVRPASGSRRCVGTGVLISYFLLEAALRRMYLALQDIASQLLQYEHIPVPTSHKCAPQLAARRPIIVKHGFHGRQGEQVEEPDDDVGGYHASFRYVRLSQSKPLAQQLIHQRGIVKTQGETDQKVKHLANP